MTIEKLSYGGDGIARVSNFVIFVPYSAPGDEVRIRITEKKKDFARGRILRILKEGEDRVKPPCPYFFAVDRQPPAPSPPPRFSGARSRPGGADQSPPLWCGGCNFQHIHYPGQLKQKTEVLKEALEKIGGLSDFALFPAIGMHPDSEWRYRNKIQIPFGRNGQEVVAGFFAPSSHRIVPMEDCLIHSQGIMNLVMLVRRQMDDWKLGVYSEKTHSGWLRHLWVRGEMLSGKMLVTFVTSEDPFPRRAEWTRLIHEKFPEVTGICQNINGKRTNVILGKKWKKIWGEDFLVESIDRPNGAAPLKLRVSAGSFFQVNTKMAEKLYRVVKDMVSERGRTPGLLLDLYCGVGGIGLGCSDLFEHVVGVDETYSSIQDAKDNARLNRISNCKFLRFDVSAFLRDFSLDASATKLGGSAFGGYRLPLAAVVLDPPRSGCTEEVLKGIARLKSPKIVYVSCDPSTLARDLKFLSRNGYRLDKVQPVDLFPESSHIESVSLLIPTA